MRKEEILRVGGVLNRYAPMFHVDIEQIPFILSTIQAECGFNPRSERFNYTLKRFKEVFKRKYRSAYRYLYGKNEKRVANIVYANRLGNGSRWSGDGNRYKGRGYPQLTGKANYKAVSDVIEKCALLPLDLEKNPKLLNNKGIGILAILAFWNMNNMNKCKTMDEVTKIYNSNLNQIDVNKRNVYLKDINKILQKAMMEE